MLIATSSDPERNAGQHSTVLLCQQTSAVLLTQALKKLPSTRVKWCEGTASLSESARTHLAQPASRQEHNQHSGCFNSSTGCLPQLAVPVLLGSEHTHVYCSNS